MGIEIVLSADCAPSEIAKLEERLVSRYNGELANSLGNLLNRTLNMAQRYRDGVVRPVLWRTLGFEGVPEAHQLMRENKHLGKISILVGANAEGEGKTEEGPGAIRAEVGA